MLTVEKHGISSVLPAQGSPLSSSAAILTGDVGAGVL